MRGAPQEHIMAINNEKVRLTEEGAERSRRLFEKHFMNE